MRRPRLLLACLAVVFVAPASTLPPPAPADQAGSTATEAALRALARRAARDGRDDRPEEAARHYWRKRTPDGRPLDAEVYLRALRRMESMPQHSATRGIALPSRAELAAGRMSAAAAKAATADWRLAGPTNVGGRTRALLIHPRQPTIMYTASVAGGVWKSVDGGASWRPTGPMGHLAVSALAMDPRDPEVLYAGTGEGFLNSDAVTGFGIFKTVDGGVTWRHLAATTPQRYDPRGLPYIFDTSDSWRFVNDVVVSRRYPGTVYAATKTGIFRSRDGGESWRHVARMSGHWNDHDGGCTDLALRGDQPHDVLLAACGLAYYGGVYLNERAESTQARAWKRVLSHDGTWGRVSLAVSPSHPNVVYALAQGTGTTTEAHRGLLAVFRSRKGGAAGSWERRVDYTSPTKLDRLLLTNPLVASAVECGLGDHNTFINQGTYDNVIAVDPKDPNVVWAGGIDLFRSDDGGASWGVASYWWANDVDLSAPPPSSYVHADQHVLAFHPGYDGAANQVLFVGNDGGVFATRNARGGTARGLGVCDYRATGIRWEPRNAGYATAQFYDGAVAADGNLLLGGTQDNGTQRRTAGGTWQEVLGGDGGHVAIDPRDPAVLYATHPFGGFKRSLDGVQTWVEIRNGIGEPRSTLLYTIVSPLAMDPLDPDRLLSGGRHLWLSEDRGDRWAAFATLVGVHTDPYGPAAVTALALRGDRWIAGTFNGDLTVNGNYTYLQTPNSDGGAFTTYISSVLPHPGERDTYFATSSRVHGFPWSFMPDEHSFHVWKTTDGGRTWSPLDGRGPTGLPNVPAHSLALDPRHPQRLFVGTDLGIFSSTDGGRTWAVEATAFPNTVTEKLVVVEVGTARKLVAFTHGRGAWEATLAD